MERSTRKTAKAPLPKPRSPRDPAPLPKRREPSAPGPVPRTGAGSAARPIKIPDLALALTDESLYCRAARAARNNEFWWYFNGLTPAWLKGFSKPLQSRDGRWWLRVKPGLAWPVDFLQPLADEPRWGRAGLLLGWQWPVDRASADSRIHFNMIVDLARYDLDAVAPNKRRAVARGLRALDVSAIDPSDPRLVAEAVDVWNSHVARTRWNRPMNHANFAASWRELAAWPGTTVVAARERNDHGRLCAWAIVRCMDDTLFVDTLASHSDRLGDRPNDAIIFACLMAARSAGLSHAHYSLVSRVKSIETFKQSLGFVPHPIPTRLHLRWPLRRLLALVRPDLLKRMQGAVSAELLVRFSNQARESESDFGESAGAPPKTNRETAPASLRNDNG